MVRDASSLCCRLESEHGDDIGDLLGDAADRQARQNPITAGRRDGTELPYAAMTACLRR